MLKKIWWVFAVIIVGMMVALIVTENCHAGEIDRKIKAFYWSTAAADLGTTWHGLEHHGAQEINPVVKNLDTGEQVVVGAALKVGAWYGIVALHRRHPRLARRVAIGLSCVQLVVAVHNYAEVH